jgi:hypothetical protein
VKISDFTIQNTAKLVEKNNGAWRTFFAAAKQLKL